MGVGTVCCAARSNTDSRDQSEGRLRFLKALGTLAKYIGEYATPSFVLVGLNIIFDF